MEGHPPIQLPPGCFKFGPAGAAVLLARICHELQIQKLVNAMVKYDVKQCKVSPGALVVAMIINLFVDRKPLYQVMSFYKDYDLATLFTERFDVSALNDDALGQMLDRRRVKRPDERFGQGGRYAWSGRRRQRRSKSFVASNEAL
jgi:hypothetical protein